MVSEAVARCADTGQRQVLVVEQTPLAAKLLTVISLRRYKNETRKLLPPLSAKHFYDTH